MPEYADVPEEVLVPLRAIAASLPETYEEPAWTGVRWRIRTRTFAHVLVLDEVAGPTPILTFRSAGEELDVLFAAGHPFFRLGWGRDVVGMVLERDTDWQEVAELVTDSYCVMAPKRLAALVDRPPG